MRDHLRVSVVSKFAQLGEIQAVIHLKFSASKDKALRCWATMPLVDFLLCLLHRTVN